MFWVDLLDQDEGQSITSTVLQLNGDMFTYWSAFEQRCILLLKCLWTAIRSLTVERTEVHSNGDAFSCCVYWTAFEQWTGEGSGGWSHKGRVVEWKSTRIKTLAFNWCEIDLLPCLCTIRYDEGQHGCSSSHVLTQDAHTHFTCAI